MSRVRKLNVFILLTAAILLAGSSADAHSVNIFAWIEGRMVISESYFSGGGKVRQGLVEVLDPSGRKLLEGRTDEKGGFSFELPREKKIRLVLNTPMGHRGDFTLEIEETAEAGHVESTKQETEQNHHHTTEIDTGELRAIIEDVVGDVIDQRLKPIHRALANVEIKKKPGAREIMGGVGYIAGIMGLVLYFRSRRKT